MKKLSLLLIFIFNFMNNTYAQNEDYLFMVEQATKAPSGHNTQPWLFKINDNSIEIHPNSNKSLQIVDFDNRELFVSLGCATENLCIAATAKGYNTAVSTGKNGIITINLTKNDTVSPTPLLAQIAVRQTNRSIYNNRLIADDTIKVLQTVSIESGINMHFYKQDTPDFNTISSFVYKGNTIQMENEAFTKELKQWIRYNKKHQDETNDGLSYATFGAPNLPRFIVKPIISNAFNAKKQNKSDKKKIESSSHFVLFTIQNNTIEEWINLGRSLERFLLKSTEQGIVHSYLNQPNEIRELAQQMSDSLNIFNEHPIILLRIGYGKSMPYSKRKGIETVLIE